MPLPVWSLVATTTMCVQEKEGSPLRAVCGGSRVARNDLLLGRNAELGGSEVWHRGAGRLVEGYLSTLLPCHNNEARERARQSDGAAYRRPAKKRRPTVAAQSDQF